MPNTTTELADYYVDRQIFNERTAKNYTSIAQRFDELTDSPGLGELGEPIILSWRKKVLKSASHTTYNTYLRHLKALFKYGVGRKIIPIDPFLDISYAPQPTQLPKALEMDELDKIFKYLKGQDKDSDAWFWEISLRFLLLSGARLRQLIAIVWHDIDFDRCELKLSTKGSKTYKEWKIPLLENTVDDLVRLKARCDESGIKTMPDGQVFNITHWNHRYVGELMTDEQVKGYFTRLSNQLGFKVSAHRFRHTTGTILGNLESTNVFTLQTLLGHSNIKTTRQYVSTKTDSLRALLRHGFENQGK